MRKPWAAVFALILTGSSLAPAQVPPREAPIPGASPVGTMPAAVPPESGKAPWTDAESVMKALSRAYPDRVGPAEFVDGDWTVVLEGVRYYYAGARLLPESLRGRIADYDPQPFYEYPADLADWKAPDAAETALLKAITSKRESNPPRRSQHFLDALWRSRNKAESYDRIKTILFFKHELMVHYSILEELSLVEERIREIAKSDPETRSWVGKIGGLTGWNWRIIADTKSRSFHSYGAAIDILPAKDDGLATYWLWSSESNKEWWTIPYRSRRHPPKKVVEAFESQGFVWGGKWRLFDTMHFEYRPEILVLNGMR